MKPVTVYGVVCTRRDEKQLMQRVNGYLAQFSRTTSKAKNPQLLEAYLPGVIRYFYFNLNKDTGTTFDVYPNEDVEGRWFFPDRKDCAWLLRVRIIIAWYPAATQEKAERFIGDLLAAIGYELVVLQESDTL